MKLYLRPIDHTEDGMLLANHLLALEQHAHTFAPIDINIATAEQLENQLAVAEPLSRRIILYRDKLGGFVSVDQYAEVYGLPPACSARLKHQTFVASHYSPKKISLNQSAFKVLVAHPYITPLIAKAIITYRKQQGKFVSIMDIQKLPMYEAKWAAKIAPYLSV